MNITIKNISDKTLSVFVSCFTIKPAIAWHIAANNPTKHPNEMLVVGSNARIVNKKPKSKAKVLNKFTFSLKKKIPPKKINNGVVKLIVIAWLRGINVYDKNKSIIVKDPKKLLNKSSHNLLVLKIFVFENKTSGTIKIILNIFRKKACWKACISFPMNFINPAKIEKKKQEAIM